MYDDPALGQIGSILLLVLGIWTVADRPYLEELLGTQVYAAAAYIIIAVGVVAFFVSFLGCFGALKEIKCMLLMVSNNLFYLYFANAHNTHSIQYTVKLYSVNDLH